MPENYTAERTISGMFKNEQQVNQVLQQLVDQGVSRDHISVLGRNFQSETRIAGFITKRDVILGGLRQGAIFGSLFGSLLGLLSGVGVLFIPFIGTVVAAGPIGGVLLGAASGALAGGAGAGLASALSTLGMPEDKAAVYQTRIQAGEFLVMAEVPADRADAIQSPMQNAGGEELHVNESPLPRATSGRISDIEHLAPEVRSHLSPEAQQAYIDRYNIVFDETLDDGKAERAAWDMIHQQFDEDENGIWSKQKVTA